MRDEPRGQYSVPFLSSLKDNSSGGRDRQFPLIESISAHVHRRAK